METLVRSALQSLLTELTAGAGPTACWVLNREDQGMIDLLTGLPAGAASRAPAGRKSIAAHTGHVLYALELLNRWAAGEENPFATADWPGSWRHQTVTQEQWRELVAQLRDASQTWIAHTQQPRRWDELSFTGAFASVAHIAYHLGAIRQLMLLEELDEG